MYRRLAECGLPRHSTASTDGQPPPCRHGLNGIDGQIAHGTRQVFRVSAYLCERWREFLNNGDAALRCLLLIEGHATGNDLMDMERPRRKTRRPAQFEQLLHDGVHAIDLFGNGVLESR